MTMATSYADEEGDVGATRFGRAGRSALGRAANATAARAFGLPVSPLFVCNKTFTSLPAP